MESRNPVFNRSGEFKNGGYASFGTPTPTASDLEGMYSAPSATPVHTGRMTLDDVVVRTATLFAVLLATAAPTYFIWKPGFLPVIAAALIGFGLAMVVSFSKKVRPPLMLAYAAIEGVFVGGISYFYASWQGNDLIPQAVLGTLAAFATMLALYKTGVVRNSPRFQKTLIIAAVGYMVFGLVNFLLAAFTGWQSVYSGGGLLPIVVSAFGVVLASFFLILDFDFVEQGIANGLPQQFAWTAAFGLVVTLVWLYLEILRLLAILRGDN